jgi:DNA helicase II / ATP-dependent DNA helicase PcrA
MDQAAGRLLEEIGRQRHAAVHSGATQADGGSIQADAVQCDTVQGAAVQAGDNRPAGGTDSGNGDNRTLRPFAARWAEEAALLLERRGRRARSRDVHLPGHISASTLVALDEDPAAVVQRLRRPVPREPGMSARKGTVFHAWVEEYYGSAGMLDLDEAPGSDDHIDEAYGLDDMVSTFRDSEWAHRSPAHVEMPVETRVGDVVVRGRIDAVFRDADGGWDLIDWKTGRKPSSGQLKTKSVQLALYRLAWARLKGVPLEEVRAAFYYVADNQVVRPHDLASGEELEAIVRAALARPEH